MAKLSVIIPCFNGYEYLKQMVDCCKRQSFTDWELIIVDDGSVDGTFAKIKSYTENDSRIHIYQRNRLPKGSLTCRNIGFEHSSGKYIIHFDADDIFTDNCFEQRVKFLDENPECDYATFLAQGFYYNKRNEVKYSSYYGLIDNNRDILERFLSVSYPFSIWCNIYRREIVEKYPWDEKVKVYSDFSYALPMIFDEIPHLFAQNKVPDYLYRKFYSKHNMCASAINQDKCKSTNYLFAKTLHALSQREDAEKRKTQFLHFIVLHFERLVNGRIEKDIDDYINTIRPYYDATIIEKLKSIKSSCLKIPKNSLMRVVLDFELFRKFKYKAYKIQLVHSIGKLILFRF